MVGRIVGFVAGFVVGELLTEVVFPNNPGWPDALPFGLAVAGWLAGSSLIERFRARRRPLDTASH